jgi:hypothetical protein
MLSIAECLFFVLDQQSAPVGGTTSPVGDTLELGSCSSTTFLAPILASMFLDVVLSLNANASDDLQNIQWAFWELAKRLAAFSERLRRGKRSMAIYTKRVSRMSSEQLLSPTAASVLRDIETTSVTNRAKFQLQLHLSNIQQQGLSFQIDDGSWLMARRDGIPAESVR